VPSASGAPLCIRGRSCSRSAQSAWRLHWLAHAHHARVAGFPRHGYGPAHPLARGGQLGLQPRAARGARLAGQPLALQGGRRRGHGRLALRGRRAGAAQRALQRRGALLHARWGA